MSIKLYTALFLCSLLVFGCGQSKSQEEKTETVSVKSAAETQKVNYLLGPKAFQEKVNSDKNAVIIDVRTQGEIDKGYIKDMVHIDFTSPDFKKNVAALDKSKNYYVYCAVGGRSGNAKKIMDVAGFKTVYDLKGGFTAWKADGLTVTK